MLRKPLFLAAAALVVALATSSKAQAWGCYHVGYSHYGPVTGYHHYGYTRASGGGYGGYHYGGYHYGGYGGGYRYGYYRRW